MPVAQIAAWDGSQWSDLGGGVSANSGVPAVGALLPIGSGSKQVLYAAGWFETAGGVPASGLARWDGVNWRSLGAGTDDFALALARYDDEQGPALYAGGYFATAGGFPSSRIARWGCDGLIGDVNGDNTTDLTDLGSLLVAFGACAGDADFLPGADLSGDECIDLNDLLILLDDFGHDCGF